VDELSEDQKLALLGYRLAHQLSDRLGWHGSASLVDRLARRTEERSGGAAVGPATLERLGTDQTAHAAEFNELLQLISDNGRHAE
jgi:hypothetical protein